MEGSEDTDLLRMVDLGWWVLLKKFKKGKKMPIEIQLVFHCLHQVLTLFASVHQDPANRADCQKEQQLLLLARLYLVLE